MPINRGISHASNHTQHKHQTSAQITTQVLQDHQGVLQVLQDHQGVLHQLFIKLFQDQATKPLKRVVVVKFESEDPYSL